MERRARLIALCFILLTFFFAMHGSRDSDGDAAPPGTATQAKR